MLDTFRIVSLVEGLSYLILLFIAMPIKYLGENPYPVKIIGMTHGILFIIFTVALFVTISKYKWKKEFGFKLFAYSLFPFGAIVIEKRIKNLF